MKQCVPIFLVLSLLAAALWGCASQTEEETGPVVWYAGDVAEWSSDSKAVASLPYEGGTLSVEGLVSALLTAPSGDNTLRSSAPAGTRMLGWTLDNGLLRVDLSEEYGSLTGMELTIADYCFTLTLSQLSEVDRVSVTVEGRPLDYRHRQEFREEQVVFSGAEEIPVEVSAALYFPRAAGRGLGLETRVLRLTEGEVLAEIATQALLSGPQDEELSSIIPEGTQLRSVQMEDGVCVVDFSSEFISGMPVNEESQLLVIYSIVDTLGNLEPVEAVRFRVEGEDLLSYGSVGLADPMEPDFGLSYGD